jgi:hypothetical protein
MIRVANLYDMFERSHTAQDEVVIDYFRLNPNKKNVLNLSANASLIADDDYIQSVIDNGTYLKYSEDEKNQGGDNDEQSKKDDDEES